MSLDQSKSPSQDRPLVNPGLHSTTPKPVTFDLSASSMPKASLTPDEFENAMRLAQSREMFQSELAVGLGVLHAGEHMARNASRIRRFLAMTAVGTVIATTGLLTELSTLSSVGVGVAVTSFLFSGFLLAGFKSSYRSAFAPPPLGVRSPDDPFINGTHWLCAESKPELARNYFFEAAKVAPDRFERFRALHCIIDCFLREKESTKAQDTLIQLRNYIIAEHPNTRFTDDAMQMIATKATSVLADKMFDSRYEKPVFPDVLHPWTNPKTCKLLSDLYRSLGPTRIMFTGPLTELVAELTRTLDLNDQATRLELAELNGILKAPIIPYEPVEKKIA